MSPGSTPHGREISRALAQNGAEYIMNPSATVAGRVFVKKTVEDTPQRD